MILCLERATYFGPNRPSRGIL